MVVKLLFGDDVYEYLRVSKATQVLRSRIYRLGDRSDQSAYQHLLTNFKNWVFYFKPYEFNGDAVNEVFFDFDRMLAEYSLHYGIKSGQEIVNDGAMKPMITKSSKSIEEFIEKSLNGLDKHLENTLDVSIQAIIDEINNCWRKSFMINCVPNVINGNYINIPTRMVSVECVDGPVSFDSDEQYFFSFLGRVPLRINKIKILNDEVYNIVNTSIVPIFLTTNVQYIIEKDIQ